MDDSRYTLPIIICELNSETNQSITGNVKFHVDQDRE